MTGSRRCRHPNRICDDGGVGDAGWRRPGAVVVLVVIGVVRVVVVVVVGVVSRRRVGLVEPRCSSPPSSSPSVPPCSPRPRPRPRRPRRRRRLAGRSDCRRRRPIVVVVGIVGVVASSSARRSLGPAVRRDEQRHVVRDARPPVSSISRDSGSPPRRAPRSRSLDGRDGLRRPVRASRSRTRTASTRVHAGMRAADPSVQFGSVRRAPACWWSRALGPANGPLAVQAGPRAARQSSGSSEVWATVYHVFSSSPRARPCRRGHARASLCVRVTSPGLVMVSPRAARARTRSAPV